MATVDRENLDAANTAVETAIQDTLAGKSDSVWAQLTKVGRVDGTSADIVYGDHGAALRKWLGSRQMQGVRTFRLNVELEKYEKSLEIDVDDLNGDQTGVLRQLVNDFMNELDADLEKVVIEHLLSNPTGADGVSLLNNSHPYVGGGGTVDNLSTNALDRTELVAASKQLRAMKDAAGRNLKIRPTHLVVGPDQAEKAVDLVGAEKPVTVGESGQINAGSSGVGSTKIGNFHAGIQVLVSGEITGNEWFLCDLSKQSKPMALFEFNNEPLRSDAFDQPTDRNVVLENKAMFLVTGKMSPAPLDWRAVYGSVS